MRRKKNRKRFSPPIECSIPKPIAQAFNVMLTFGETYECSVNCPFRHNDYCTLADECVGFDGTYTRTQKCLEGGCIRIKI